MSLEHKIPPPLLAIVCAGLMSIAAQLLPGLSVPLPALWRWTCIGMLLCVTVVFDGAALLAFRRAKTTIDPRKPDQTQALVTTGVYRWTRNPMYVGLTALLAAWAVYLGSMVALALLVAFVLYLSRFQIAPEERALHLLFGDDFEQYCARVRRWL